MALGLCFFGRVGCTRRELNPHALRRRILSPVRLPIPPLVRAPASIHEAWKYEKPSPKKRGYATKTLSPKFATLPLTLNAGFFSCIEKAIRHERQLPLSLCLRFARNFPWRGPRRILRLRTGRQRRRRRGRRSRLVPIRSKQLLRKQCGRRGQRRRFIGRGLGKWQRGLGNGRRDECLRRYGLFPGSRRKL